MDINNILTASLKKFGLDYNDEQIYQILHYLDLVYQCNKKVNIVGTKDKNQILIRHILDCLSILKYKKDFFYTVKNNIKILDVGTGAGLPGILLAIFLKKNTFYLLDKKAKKIEFLKMVIDELNLSNIFLIKGRAQELAHNNLYREKFEVVVARAVAKFKDLCELIIPFSKINGKIILYKSKKVFEELQVFGRAVTILGGKIEKIQEVSVPYLEEYRAFLVIKKEERSPFWAPGKFKKIKDF